MTATPTRARARLRTLLITASLTAVSLAGLNASPAGAEEPQGPPDGRNEDARIVHDEGLDSRPRTDSAPNLVACYDGAVAWNAGTSDTDGYSHRIPGWDDHPDWAVGDTPVHLTSSNCNDVNLRITSVLTEPLQARVCFYPTEQPDYCNQWSEIPVGDTGWHVIATSVIDGTRYAVEFANPGEYVDGYVAD